MCNYTLAYSRTSAHRRPSCLSWEWILRKVLWFSPVLPVRSPPRTSTLAFVNFRSMSKHPCSLVSLAHYLAGMKCIPCCQSSSILSLDHYKWGFPGIQCLLSKKDHTPHRWSFTLRCFQPSANTNCRCHTALDQTHWLGADSGTPKEFSLWGFAIALLCLMAPLKQLFSFDWYQGSLQDYC